LLAQIGAENIFPATVNPTAATRQALLRAKQLLPDQKAQVRIFYERDRLPGDHPPAPPTPPAASA
ncbi:MAG TPA: hypothetical protein VG710_17415, partial [Opitutus sp.]|nr:hypothetical protein [Opitutus sp.]